MTNKDVINVYWAPWYEKTVDQPQDWSMLYPDPTNLYSDLIKIKNNDEKRDSFLICPATQDLFKKTYVFKNSITCKYKYDFSKENKNIEVLTDQYLQCYVHRNPSINSGPLIRFSLSYVLFSDSPLLATFSSPYFSKPEYSKYGVPVPGQFDIGQWFRPYVMEMQMWENQGIFELKENEPLFYVNFNTDKKIKIHRFSLNNTLFQYGEHCITSAITFGPFQPLSKRYLRFKQARLNDSILAEIKNNLVGEVYDR